MKGKKRKENLSCSFLQKNPTQLDRSQPNVDIIGQDKEDLNSPEIEHLLFNPDLSKDLFARCVSSNTLQSLDSKVVFETTTTDADDQKYCGGGGINIVVRPKLYTYLLF